MDINFHHIGIVVKSIDQYERQLFFEKKENDLIDELQSARLTLYKNFNNSFIELIEPLNENSPSYNALVKNGNHINHYCYSIDNYLSLTELAQARNWLKVMGPIPAKLFDNKNVVFYLDRNRQLIEFIINI